MGNKARKKEIAELKQQIKLLNQQIIFLESQNQKLAEELMVERQRSEGQQREYQTSLTAVLKEHAEAGSRAEAAQARSDAIILTLTQQLDRLHLQLAVTEKRQSLWQRMKCFFA